MTLAKKLARITTPAFFAASLASAMASAQPVDAAAAAKWEKLVVVHYELIGTVADKHVQIPPTDADLYADVSDTVHISFDWNTKTKTFVGKPKFANLPGKVSNVVGMGGKCPTGKLDGPYEHFDILELRQSAAGESIEVVGQQVRPDTHVAEACGSLVYYKGGVSPRTEYIDPPDPQTLAFGKMLPADGPLKVSPDGKSIIMTALNNNFIWTYTPSAK